MLHTSRTLIISGVLLLVLIATAVYWVDNVEESLLISSADTSLSSGIEKIDIEFSKRKIYLNVHISKPLTCKEVIDTLGIQTLPIKEKVFVPTCSAVSKELIRVVYTEAISV